MKSLEFSLSGYRRHTKQGVIRTYNVYRYDREKQAANISAKLPRLPLISEVAREVARCKKGPGSCATPSNNRQCSRGGMGVKQRRKVMAHLAAIPDEEERLILATGR